jgi:hypothetical protein
VKREGKEKKERKILILGKSDFFFIKIVRSIVCLIDSQF